ncbi:MAG TPA: hypothetical protein V6D47_05160 [Oscillatoriaceae cyanobacterium]
MMHAVVLYQEAWSPAEDAARLVSEELGARAIALSNRPHLNQYDLVVIATSPMGLWDPRLWAFLGSGELRGKVVAFVHDLWLPGAEAYLEAWHSLTRLSGAVVHHQPLLVSSSLLSGLSGSQRASIRAWGRALRAEFPPPTYPHGEAGRRRVG